MASRATVAAGWHSRRSRSRYCGRPELHAQQIKGGRIPPRNRL